VGQTPQCNLLDQSMAIKHRLCSTIYAAQPLNPGSKLFFNFLWWGLRKLLAGREQQTT